MTKIEIDAIAVKWAVAVLLVWAMVGWGLLMWFALLVNDRRRIEREVERWLRSHEGQEAILDLTSPVSDEEQATPRLPGDGAS